MVRTLSIIILLLLHRFQVDIIFIFFLSLWPLFIDGIQVPQGCRVTTRRQFTFYKYVPRNSWYSFDQLREDEQLSRLWSHPVVVNTESLDWESSVLTTLTLQHFFLVTAASHAPHVSLNIVPITNHWVDRAKGRFNNYIALKIFFLTHHHTLSRLFTSTLLRYVTLGTNTPPPPLLPCDSCQHQRACTKNTFLQHSNINSTISI